MIKYSVIIPVLNGEKELPSLLDSIDAQKKIDRSELEVIVGLSPRTTDSTRRVAESYGCIIVDGGMPAKGRNNAAKEARGRYYFFKDADSPFPHDNFLNEVVHEFDKRGLDVATTLYYAYTTKNGFAKWRYDKWIGVFANGATLKAENTDNPLMMNFMVARKHVHEALTPKGFREDLEFAEDAEYAKRAKAAGFRFGVLKDCKPVGFSMRKLESSPLAEIVWLFKNTYFNAGRALGHEFVRGKSIIPYWEKS